MRSANAKKKIRAASAGSSVKNWVVDTSMAALPPTPLCPVTSKLGVEVGGHPAPHPPKTVKVFLSSLHATNCGQFGPISTLILAKPPKKCPPTGGSLGVNHLHCPGRPQRFTVGRGPRSSTLHKRMGVLSALFGVFSDFEGKGLGGDCCAGKNIGDGVQPKLGGSAE